MDGDMHILLVIAFMLMTTAIGAQTWTADNGNGTFTNPLFYDEFSDPDLIRVGDDFYLTGTTMHAMPGLPILHSRDMVNWTFLTYACDKLDFGPAYRLEEGKSVYGQGIWAPCFRYHNGTFYIFSNVNGQKTQLFRATNPAGPWTRTAMKVSLHDLSVLFDDDGKAYVVWGYQDLRLAQLNDTLDDLVPGSEKIITQKDSGMGEGVHFYKINGKYYLLSAWFAGRMRMPCARADKPEGPWEVNPAISIDESFGLAEGLRLGRGDHQPGHFNITPGNTNDGGRMSLHQGGIVDTPTGEWWGWSMMDANSVGRLTALSPVTWKDGWPYFGLPGNLTRTPRTWVKPNTGSAPSAPYERNDDFAGEKLKPVWQWNHVPVDGKWSLTERAGFLRLHSLPAKDFWNAKNTLTQRAVGPKSTATTILDVSGMKDGDVAGLGLLNYPYAWIGVKCDNGLTIEQYSQLSGKTARAEFTGGRLWLRAECDFLADKAQFSFSTDGKKFEPLGEMFEMIFTLRTFQGVRYSLFHFNSGDAPGGVADFDELVIHEPHPRGLMRPIPYGKTITLPTFGNSSALVVKDGNVVSVPGNDPAAIGPGARFTVQDRGLGRVALKSADGWVSVIGDGQEVKMSTVNPGDAETFQWTETVYGDLILMSLTTHRHLRINPQTGAVTADHPSPLPDRKDGSCFVWKEVAQ